MDSPSTPFTPGKPYSYQPAYASTPISDNKYESTKDMSDYTLFASSSALSWDIPPNNNSYPNNLESTLIVTSDDPSILKPSETINYSQQMTMTDIIDDVQSLSISISPPGSPPPPTQSAPFLSNFIDSQDEDTDDNEDQYIPAPSSSSSSSIVFDEETPKTLPEEQKPFYERHDAIYNTAKSPFKWASDITDIARYFTMKIAPTQGMMFSGYRYEIQYINHIVREYEKGTLLYPYSPDNVYSIIEKLRNLKLFRMSILSPFRTTETILKTIDKFTDDDRDYMSVILNVQVVLNYILVKLLDKNLEKKMEANRLEMGIKTQEKYGYVDIDGIFHELPSVYGVDVQNRLYDSLEYQSKYTSIKLKTQPKRNALGFNPYIRAVDEYGRLDKPMVLSPLLMIFYDVRILDNHFQHLHKFIRENEGLDTEHGWEIQEFLIKTLQEFFMPSKKWFENQIDRLWNRRLFREEYELLENWKLGYSVQTEEMNMGLE